MNQIIVRVNHS